MKILVIAPHPDDETLGCGGAMLKMRETGAELYWLIATTMTEADGFSSERITQREQEIAQVAKMFSFRDVFRLGYPCARLDGIGMTDLVAAIGKVVRSVEPHTIFLPFPGDPHTDHRIVHQAAFSCTKWFRYPSVRRVLTYEVLSETDAGNILDVGFRPNVFVDITEQLERKMEIVRIFGDEIGTFPFPRSEQALRHLAGLRGCQAGTAAAEAFMLLRGLE